jgi:hypothetical protein
LKQNSTALCPRELYPKDLENIINFRMGISLTLMECQPKYGVDCKYNATVYDEIKRGDYGFMYTSYFKASTLNIFNNQKPFISNIVEEYLLLKKRNTMITEFIWC